ncbi:MAG: flagellar basal body-associated protein FliL [Comamonadaceae bacterium]
MSTPAPKPVPQANDASLDVGTKKSRKKLVAMLALFLLAGGGLATWLLLPLKTEGKESARNKTEVASSGPPVFIVMDPFTVNLQPEGQFLQATFTLQAANAEESESIKLYMPQVRSRLLLMLSNKNVAELSTVQGKTQLGTEIASLIENPFAVGLKPIKVSNVFFTSFVIQ